jgi:hypothetical protein
VERAIDERLRARFFPNAKQSFGLEYALLRQGKVVRKINLELSTEDRPGVVGTAARFQPTPDGRLFVVYHASGKDETGKPLSENRVREILSGGTIGPAVRLPLKHPFTTYFTATPRAGSPVSRTLEMMGEQQGRNHTISYAKVRLY